MNSMPGTDGILPLSNRSAKRGREAPSALLGFVAAALPPPVAHSALLALFDQELRHRFMGLLWVTAYFYAYSFLAAAVFGGAVFLLLRGVDLVRWWSAAVGGLLIGAALAILSPTRIVLLQGSDLIAFCMTTGGVSGLVWFVRRASTGQANRHAHCGVAQTV